MRALVHPLIALAAFVATAGGVRGFLPPPEDYGLRAKLDHFRVHKDELDVLFLGSSRVVRGVAPREVEAALLALGREVRAFNLGVQGMEAFESDALLSRVLAMEPARLRLVVIEAGRWDPRGDLAESGATLRTVLWHTPGGLRNVVEAIAVGTSPAGEKLAELLRHAKLFGLWVGNVGRGGGLVAVLRGRTTLDERRLQGVPPDLAGLGGWHPAEEVSSAFDRSKWQRLVEQARRSEGRGADPPPNALAHFPDGALRRQVARTRAAGCEIAYLAFPTSEGRVFTRVLDAFGLLPNLVAYTRPSEHPELFRFELRADANHLNSRGAQLLSRMLAADLAPLLAERP